MSIGAGERTASHALQSPSATAACDASKENGDRLHARLRIGRLAFAERGLADRRLFGALPKLKRRCALRRFRRLLEALFEPAERGGGRRGQPAGSAGIEQRSAARRMSATSFSPVSAGGGRPGSGIGVS